MKIDVPVAPPKAAFGVIVNTVGGSARTDGPDVTTDFQEFPVTRTRTRQPPRDSIIKPQR